MPPHIVDEELVLQALQIDCIMADQNIRNIPKHMQHMHSIPFFLKVLKISHSYIRYIPHEYRTKEIVVLYASIMELPDILKWVLPELVRDNEVQSIISNRFSSSVVKDIQNMLGVAHPLISYTKEEWTQLIMEKTVLLNQVPRQYYDREMCLVHIRAGGTLLGVDLKYINKEFCLEAVKNNISNIHYIPKNILDKDIVEQAKLHTNIPPEYQVYIDNFYNYVNYYDCIKGKIYYSIDSIDLLLKELGNNCIIKENNCTYNIYEIIEKVIPGYIYNSYEYTEKEKYIIFKH